MSVRKVKSAPSKLNTETRKNILERLIENIDLSGELSNYVIKDSVSIKNLYNTSRLTREFVLDLKKEEEVFAANSEAFKKIFMHKSKIVKSATKEDRMQIIEKITERIQSVKKAMSHSAIVEGIEEIERLFNTLYSKTITSYIIYILHSLKHFFEYIIQKKHIYITNETTKRDLKTKVDRYSILEYEFNKCVLCISIKNKNLPYIQRTVTYLHSTSASNVIKNYYFRYFTGSPDYNKYVKILFYLFNGQNELPLNMGENVVLYKTLVWYNFIDDKVIPIENFKTNMTLHKQIFKKIFDFIYGGGLKIELFHDKIDLTI